MATLPLRIFPFDILESIFENLDSATLHSLCLVSHAVCETASPILYRTMIWWPISLSPWTNVYQDEFLGRTKMRRESTIGTFCNWLSGSRTGEEEPCIEAFLRRPSLRTYVRTIIFTQGSTTTTEASLNKLFECARRELNLMPSVVKLEWRDSYRGARFSSPKFTLLVSVMENMKSLQEIVFPSMGSQIMLSLSLTRRLKRMAFDDTSGYAVKMYNSPWFRSTNGHLEALTFKSEITPITGDLLSNFTQLRVLKLKHVGNLPEFVASLRPMSQLRELFFSLQITDTEYALGEPLQLEHLQILNIELRQYFFFEHLVPRLRLLYKCLTSNSKQIQEVQLHHDLPHYNYTTNPIDKILTDILHFHPRYIRCLRLDKFTISPESLLSLGLQLPSLQELGFFVDSEECIPRLSILRVASSLEVLRVTMPRDAKWPTIHEVKCFMIQEMPHLRKLYVHKFQPVSSTVVLWESRWTYDPTEKEVLRIIAPKYMPSSTNARKYDA